MSGKYKIQSKIGQMAQQPGATLRVFFGVELELVLTRKQGNKGKKWEKWPEAAKELSTLLQQNNIRIQVIDDDFSQPPNYKLWNIAEDGSIGKADPSLQKWGVELISSICLDTKRSEWVGTQKALWHCVENNFNIRPSEKCGTHVHVSFPSLRAFTLMRMRRVCKAVVYFELCIDSIMPLHRRGNSYCKSNRYNENLRRHQTMPEVFKAINSKTTHTQLADLVSPDRLVKWNFRHMATEVNLAKVATVEFRQPPGCTTVDEALFWQGFTLAFIGAAITSESLIDPERVPTLADLASFVSRGRFMCEDVYSGGFDEFIKMKQQLKVGMIRETSQPMRVTVVRRQDRAADLQLQKLEAAFASAAHG